MECNVMFVKSCIYSEKITASKLICFPVLLVLSFVQSLVCLLIFMFEQSRYNREIDLHTLSSIAGEKTNLNHRYAFSIQRSQSQLIERPQKSKFVSIWQNVFQKRNKFDYFQVVLMLNSPKTLLPLT